MLDTLHGPEELREMPLEKLYALAAEIRERITDVVGKNGGHLSSNLGAVELTLALHAVFDFSEDRLVFDVGHQCYAHKLLTGRAGEFETLRKKDGISGYPNPKESPYDLFVSGHAGTAISWATGLACADALAGNDRATVALVGDGALGTGVAFEALNHAGHVGADILVVLNDNEMSISKTVGALSNYLSRIRTDPLYRDLRRDARSFVERLPLVGKPFESLTERAIEAVRRGLIPGHIFEELGFRYVGPIDGHDLDLVGKTLRGLKDMRGPRLLHAITKKGRGFAPAAADPTHFHSSPAFSRESEPKGETWTRAMSDSLLELGGGKGRIVAITAGMPSGTGLDRFGKAFPKRYFDVGISEQHAVAFSAGLSRAGLKPVVLIYSTFLQRAYDQVFHDLCLQGNLGVVFGIDRAGLVGADGPTHHGLYDLAYLRHIPGTILMAPKDARELAAMLRFGVSLDRVSAIRYPRGALPEPFEACEEMKLGKGEVLSRGRKAAIVAYGAMVSEAREAVRMVEPDGLSPTLINARFSRPLDAELLGWAFSEHERVITVEDHALAGGFGSAVLEEGFPGGKLVRLGVPDRFVEHASRRELLGQLGLDAHGIAAKLREVMR